jgi:hypothetical protein
MVIRMRIGIVGGIDRAAPVLERTAAAMGCELELHTGHTAGRGAPGLESMIRRSDVVVIVTDVNSHNAVLAARKLAGALGRRTVILRKLGASRLAALIDELQGELRLAS